MRECNRCVRDGCNPGKKRYELDCPLYVYPGELKTPLIYLAAHRNAQGLHDNLQAMGLQIDPAYNRKGYVVVEAW